MSNLTWIIPPGNLGIIPEGKFYQITMLGTDVDNESNPVYYKLIAGSLPAGMQLRKTGLIEGIPKAFASFQGVPAEVGSNVASKFAVRLFTEKPDGSIDNINDRTFSITVTGQDVPQFTVDSGSLGQFYDGTLVSVHIGTSDPDPGDIVSYYISSGALPPGLSLTVNGQIEGYIIPFTDLESTAQAGFDVTTTEFDQFPFDNTAKSISKNYQFDVAITDGKETNVRTYTMYVYARNTISADTTEITADNDFVTTDQAKYRVPFITNRQGSIGTYRHDNWFAYKFNGMDLDGDIIKYELSLGDGSAFDSDGVGFDSFGVGFSANTSELPPGLTLDPLTGWLYGRIPSLNFLEKEYKFTITVSKLMTVDVASLALDWKIDAVCATTTNILLSGLQTIDGYTTSVNERVLVKNQNSAYQNGIYVVQNGAWTRAVDMDQLSPLSEFRSAAIKVTDGVANKNTAWTQISNVTNLGVSVIAFSQFMGISEQISSEFYDFNMRIVGEIEKEVFWSTDSDLGVAYNGDISTFFVHAVSKSGYVLRYKLDNSVKSRLPQGTQLQSDGSIVGRISFNTFGIDSGLTTFDKEYSTRLGNKETTYDNSFTFTVEAFDSAGLISTFKEFTIKINRKYNAPYENIYLHAMPSLENRAMLESMMQNEDIIPTELLYRPMDTNFGKNKKIETLFLHGLQPSTLSEYVSALYENFYEKKLWLGNIKTASALDKHGKVLYEVVYSTLVDDLINVEQTSISKMQMLPLEVETTNGATHWVYPNSIYNMQKQLSSVIPQIAPSALPLWMTSKQSSGNVLGYTMAWVICYTKPNESEKVAYRLRNKYSQELNKINFTINRFVTDMTMSLNYNKSTDRWKEGNITTFDRSDRPSNVNFAMQVDFATELPFAMLNSRTPAEIFAIGGIDGEITDYSNRTIIFLNQEDYTDFGMTVNDGWINYSSAMEEHPFDSRNLDEYTIVPTDGFSGYGVTNNRLGVFKFVKTNGIYHLEHVRNFTNSEYVQVLYGKSHRNNDFFIPLSPAPGSTMITWRAILKVQRRETMFDMQGTRFISPVDKYSTNNQLAKYVAFPKKNILG